MKKNKKAQTTSEQVLKALDNRFCSRNHEHALSSVNKFPCLKLPRSILSHGTCKERSPSSVESDARPTQFAVHCIRS